MNCEAKSLKVSACHIHSFTSRGQDRRSETKCTRNLVDISLIKFIFAVYGDSGIITERFSHLIDALKGLNRFRR